MPLLPKESVTMFESNLNWAVSQEIVCSTAKHMLLVSRLITVLSSHTANERAPQVAMSNIQLALSSN